MKSKFVSGNYRFTIEAENKDTREDSKLSVFYFKVNNRKNAENILTIAVRAIESMGLSVKSYSWEIAE